MNEKYDKSYLEITCDLLGNMFEVSCNNLGYKLEDFFNILLKYEKLSLIENADPILVCGKSSIEIMSLVLNIEPKYYYQNQFASPEYFTGYAFNYLSWYFNLSYEELDRYFPVGLLLENYFPFHEMDITNLIEYAKKYIPHKNIIKKLRLEKGITQKELALLSQINLRTIRLYEQNNESLKKATVENIIKLSDALGCDLSKLI